MKPCGFGVFGRTMPLLEGGPLHVDVGFVCQVDFTGSSENSPRLINTLRLQVLSVLNTHTHSVLLHTHIRFVWMWITHTNMLIPPWSRTPHIERRQSGSARRGCEPHGRHGRPRHLWILPGAGLWPLTPPSWPGLALVEDSKYQNFYWSCSLINSLI